jgi:hypothetical protein
MVPKRMIGKSAGGFRRLSRSEKAGNDGIDETPPSQAIGAHGMLEAGRAFAHHKIAQSFRKEKLIAGRYNSSIADSLKGEEGVKGPVEEKEVSRKGAEYAKAAKEGRDFHFAFPCAFVPLCRMGYFDFSTPSKPFHK